MKRKSKESAPPSEAGERPPTSEETYRSLLTKAREGCERSRRELVGLLYPEIRERAGMIMRSHPKGHTFQATDLANEACAKVLASTAVVSWHDHAHAMAVACTAMRHVLSDYARSGRRLKRDLGGDRVSLDAVLLIGYEDRGIDIVSLHEALERFGEVDPPMVRAIELRLFGGLSFEDIARALNMPERTFSRRWRAAQLLLDAEMRGDTK